MGLHPNLFQAIEVVGMQTKLQRHLWDSERVLLMPAAITSSPGKLCARGVPSCIIALLGCVLHFFAYANKSRKGWRLNSSLPALQQVAG